MMESKVERLLEQFRGNRELFEFSARQFERGLDYYVDRIDRLMLSGESVLDAGCGVGNWSLALSQRFETVIGIENRRDRLSVLTTLCAGLGIPNVRACLGSVEKLPFGANSFDAIFCNGVIFLTNWRASLREFARTLKPMGVLYVSCASVEWWKYLILERGPTDPLMTRFGCDAFLNRALEALACMDLAGCDALLEEFHHQAEIAAAVALSPRVVPFGFDKTRLERSHKSLWTSLKRAKPGRWLLGHIFRHFIWPALIRGRGRLSERADALLQVLGRFIQFRRACLPADRQLAILARLEESLHYVLTYGLPEQKERLAWAYLARLLPGAADYFPGSHVHAINADEMERELVACGLRPLGSSWEGTLVANSSARAVAPIYEPRQGVFEFLATKGLFLSEERWPGVDFFRGNARRGAYSYSLLQDADVLCNRSVANCAEISITRHLQHVAARLPREEFLRWLTRSLVAGQKSEEEAFYRIYRFVQDALFHHPAFQLLREDFAIESDTVTILLSGIARCGHVAGVAAELYRLAGFDARVTQLHAHVCAEVRIDGAWRVVDADLLKAGVYPRNAEGRWLTLEELRHEPIWLDALPCIGTVLSRDGAWMINAFGRACSGYVDAGLPWERPYPSYLYFGGERRCPAPPPSLVFERDREQLYVRATEISAQTVRLRVLVGSTSRGWNYQDYPDARYLIPPSADLGRYEVSAAELLEGLRIKDGLVAYVSVIALDDYMIAHPEVYAWPSEEFSSCDSA